MRTSNRGQISKNHLIYQFTWALFLISSSHKKCKIRGKKSIKKRSKTTRQWKRKSVSGCEWLYRIPNFRENRASVIRRLVLYGSMSLLNYKAGHFFKIEALMGVNLSIWKCRFISYNRIQREVESHWCESPLGSAWILLPSPRGQSKQKVGRGGEKRAWVKFLICRVFKTTGP